MTCFFSIIIPTYNSQNTISAALQSILEQSFDDFEVLILDGLSSDNTITILKSYQDERIRIISEADNGLYDAMNKGIDTASGQWLYFLGSDDKLYDDKVLEDVKNMLIKLRSNVIYGNVKIVGDTFWAKDGDIYDGLFDKKKLLKKNICHQAVFYNSDFIRTKIGHFNSDYKLCADWDFNMRCFASENFVYLDKIIANFYCGGVSTKTFKDDNFRKDFLKNTLKYFNVSVFDPLVNDLGFPEYDEIQKLQIKKNYFRYLFSRFQIKIRG